MIALKFLDCRHHSPAIIAGEVRALLNLKKIQHCNLIRIHAVTAISGYVVLSMERADGNLYDLEGAYREATGRNIYPEHLLDLMEQAATGLDFLAGRAPDLFGRSAVMQHCDVKPANLLLVGDCLKVADFGLCRSAFAGSGKSFMGTPPYAAPEQYEGRVTERSDQYALAVTWCELVAGHRVMRPIISGPCGRPCPSICKNSRARVSRRRPRPRSALDEPLSQLHRLHHRPARRGQRPAPVADHAPQRRQADDFTAPANRGRSRPGRQRSASRRGAGRPR